MKQLRWYHLVFTPALALRKRCVVWTTLRSRRQCRTKGQSSVVQFFRATHRAASAGRGLHLQAPSRQTQQRCTADVWSRRSLRCGAATAGKGFGASEEEDHGEWGEDVEELDFGYAAEVVRETWELFAETGPEEQVSVVTLRWAHNYPYRMRSAAH